MQRQDWLFQKLLLYHLHVSNSHSPINKKEKKNYDKKKLPFYLNFIFLQKNWTTILQNST